MSVITRMIERIFPKAESRILIVGLDGVGKTTSLYKLKLGEVITTIPTIGFNVETIEHKDMSLTMWDVGGCDKIRPLWRHYFQGTDAIICVVDSNRDRIEESSDELRKMLNEDELRDCDLLVLANKQDLPRAMSAAEVTEALRLHSLRHRNWFLVPSVATTGEGLHEGMDWLVKQRRNKLSGKGHVGQGGGGGGGGQGGGGAGSSSRAKVESPEEIERRRKEELLVEWLEREDNSDEEFLGQLADYTLDSWDHRTHLRIAWLMLKEHGRQKGLPLIFDAIKSFIENSKRTQRSRGTTFHETMTYFWVHMVHYATATTANPTGDFKGFLLMNPQLSNGGLFLHYYTKELMLHSPTARTQFVGPDKVPLPSLITRTDTSAPALPVQERFAPAKPLDDGAFLERFRSRTLPSWGHETKIRAIWCLLQEHGRQRGGTDKILQALEEVEGPGHNVTVAYFWIQMVTLASAKMKAGSDYARFIQLPTSQMLLNPDLIERHYTERALSNGAASFSLPDKKQLPSVVH